MLNLCFDIYHAYEKVGRVEIVGSKLIKNEVYMDNMVIRLFPASTDLHNILGIYGVGLFVWRAVMRIY